MSKPIKISTWNVNSVRTRINHLVEFIKNENPDILLLQELKCEEHQFPREEIERFGYNIAIKGQKSYNGVAILSKYRFDEIIYDFTDNPKQEQSRYIEAVISVGAKSLRIASVYVPNGSEIGSEQYYYKLEFLENLYNYIKSIRTVHEDFIIGGDFNIACDEIDAYSVSDDNVLFTIEERILLWKFRNIGLLDCYRVKHPDNVEYSWWDYRAGAFQKNLGMRIDYIFATPSIIDNLASSYMSKEYRSMEKSSDHIPVNISYTIYHYTKFHF